MDYQAIHSALKEQGLTWVTAAAAIGCSPSNLMGVAAVRTKSRHIAKRLALLIGKSVTEVFPQVPAYAEPDPDDLRRASVAAARLRLEQAGMSPLDLKTA